jgi:hypothetical protein
LTSGPLEAGEVLEHSRKEGVLRTPLADTWPPSVLHNASVELDGFDVEVTKKFGKRMGLKVDHGVNADKSAMGWEEQTSGECKGKYDIGNNTMTPSAKRAEHLKSPVAY